MHQKVFMTILLLVTLTLSGQIFTHTLITNLAEEGEVKYKVILPDSYQEERTYPALYLLHCLGGNYNNWEDISEVHELIDNYDMIIVTVGDGRSDKNCWWLDSPTKANSQWSTIICDVLKPEIDGNYTTQKNKYSTGIAGFSMGGFGAFHNAGNRPDLFGIVMAFNGALGVLSAEWLQADNVLGDPQSKPENYQKVEIIQNVSKYKSNGQIIKFNNYVGDCFISYNESVHEQMTSLKINHSHSIITSSISGHKQPLPDEMDEMLAFFSNSCKSTKPTEKTLVNLNLDDNPHGRLFVSKTEISHGDYLIHCGMHPFYKDGEFDLSRPAQNLTWYDAVIYCNKRSIKEGLKPVYSWSDEIYSNENVNNCTLLENMVIDTSKNGYRLPYIDEWRYLYYGGSSECDNNGFYWSPNELAENYEWYDANSGGYPHPIGEKNPNKYGLYDIAGNVREWLQADVGVTACAGSWGDYNSPELSLIPTEILPCANKSNNYNVVGFRIVRKTPIDMVPINMLLLGD